MKYNLNYIRILTDNFKEMYTFYSETLGMSPRFYESDGTYEEFIGEGINLALFDKKLMDLALDIEYTPRSESKGDDAVIIFQIPDVDDFYTKLKNKVKFVKEPTDRPDWRVKTVHLRDPDGYLLEFNQPM